MDLITMMKRLKDAIDSMIQMKVTPSIVVDCSHANSRKNYKRQERILHSIIDQVVRGRSEIRGFMLESNLEEGCQTIKDDPKDLLYGVSVTDACIGWNDTEKVIRSITEALRIKDTNKRG